MSSRTFRLALLTAAPALAATLATAALVALNGGGAAQIGPWPLLKLSAGYARPAEKLLAQPQPTAQAVQAAAHMSEAALREFPYDNSSWLRLAYADRLKHGQLTAEGVNFLRRSYEISGIDIYAGLWRVAFVLENSQSIPRDIRVSAKQEFQALWRDGKNRAELRQMPVAVRNPAGRLSAALWLRAAQTRATP